MKTLTDNRSFDLAAEIYRKRVAAGREILNLGLFERQQRHCPVCDSRDGREFKVFGWVCKECKRCKTSYSSLVPNEEGFKDYYSMISNLNSRLWKNSRETQVQSKFEEIEQIRKQYNFNFTKTVELGCGSGEFVAFLEQKGLQSAGIDIDEKLVKEGKENGANLICGDILSCAIPNSDLYLCYEIIEHLLDPKSFLKRIYNEMREGSFLILTTPNADGLDNKTIPPEQKDRFIASALFPPYHLNAFSLKSLYYLVLSLGYEIVDCSTPGNLDISIVNHHKNFLEGIENSQNDSLIDLWQETIRTCNGSGHMRFILRRP